MTQEEKQLLFKDLCARLPYGVKFQGEDSNVYTLDAANYFALQVEDMVFKPYLRTMSSMTKEEREELCELCEFFEPYNDRDDFSHYGIEIIEEFCVNDEKIPLREINYKVIDWLNEHHFDYRGLIPMGLALEAPKDMYKTE